MAVVEKYTPTSEHIAALDELKDAINEDMKFSYALHTCNLSMKMRKWGHDVIKMSHNCKSEEMINWMKGYPCANYSRLTMKTIAIHYPEIYEKLKYDIPVGYINEVIIETLYPLEIEF